MNFALNISQRVEAYLQEMVETRIAAYGTDHISQREEDEMYQICLERVLRKILGLKLMVTSEWERSS